MSQSNGRPAKCTNPIEATVLADYWLSLLPEAEESTVEEAHRKVEAQVFANRSFSWGEHRRHSTTVDPLADPGLVRDGPL